MTEITAPLQSTEYETAPEGTQAAICYGVILMGTMATKFGPKKKIRLIFELHGEDKMKDGRPFSVSQDFTFSSNEAATLRCFIEDWRGRKYTTPELKSMNGLPISKLIGQPGLTSISHTHDDNGSVWVNIKSIMPLPKGMPAPAIINEKLVYSVDDHDADVFSKLSPKLQDRIKGTQEWMTRTGQIASGGTPSTHIPSDFDDSIPF